MEHVQPQLDAINAKLDLLLEEIEIQKRHRREMEDLKDDLTRIGKDLYQSAVTELEEVHDHINTGDILYLGKKLIRNVNNITRAFEQMENTRDFLQDMAPVSRELFRDVMDKLDEFDRKGYFEFLREITNVTDTVVRSFSAEDVKKLGDNIVTILNTIKSLTQPDMLQTINNAVSVYKKLDIDVSDNVSALSLIRELNTPEAKRGLAFAVQFLKNLANHQQSLTTISEPQTN